MTIDSAICFLVINRNSDLPKLSIQSALDCTTADIFVGYINDSDVKDLPNNKRISYLTLDPKVVGLERYGQSYRDFADVEFYKIVQLKWQLLEKLMCLHYKYIFYSDFDVTWINNPILNIESAFENNDTLHVLIQSFTTNPAQVRLCMGFVAFRKGVISNEFIDNAQKRHAEIYKTNSLIGDDDVVTQLFNELNQPSWIRELPQSTFPVGSILNLYSKRNSFPGLSAPKPYVFHSNYVVGLMNKRILTSIISRRFELVPYSLRYTFFDLLILFKTFKFYLLRLKSRFI
jgi:hypothetical protein